MSSNRQHVQNALNELGAQLGAPLAFDQNGVVTLGFAGDVTCSIELPNDSDRVYFHAAIVRVPSADREQVFSDALALNLFHLSVAGSAVALDRESNELVLCHSAQCDTLEPDSLSGILVAIANEVQRLRANLHDAAKSAPVKLGTEMELINMIRV